jgi:hypothetical protein
MKNDLFDDESIMQKCIINNQIKARVMIDIDVTDYCFIDKVTALAIYEKNDISLVKLLRSKNVRTFNDRQKTFITLKIDD